jgi:hypothetical protein
VVANLSSDFQYGISQHSLGHYVMVYLLVYVVIRAFVHFKTIFVNHAGLFVFFLSGQLLFDASIDDFFYFLGRVLGTINGIHFIDKNFEKHLHHLFVIND